MQFLRKNIFSRKTLENRKPWPLLLSTAWVNNLPPAAQICRKYHSLRLESAESLPNPMRNCWNIISFFFFKVIRLLVCFSCNRKNYIISIIIMIKNNSNHKQIKKSKEWWLKNNFKNLTIIFISIISIFIIYSSVFLDSEST